MAPSNCMRTDRPATRNTASPGEKYAVSPEPLAMNRTAGGACPQFAMKNSGTASFTGFAASAAPFAMRTTSRFRIIRNAF